MNLVYHSQKNIHTVLLLDLTGMVRLKNIIMCNESMKKNLCMKKKHAYQNADMKSSKAMILPVLNAILAIA